MGVLPDWMIEREVKIDPFFRGRSPDGEISYGLSSYGYDVRLGRAFRLAINPGNNVVISPKRPDPRVWVPLAPENGVVILPPHSFTLAETVERFEVPRDVLVVAVGKSTYARAGLIVNITPLEPEWRGVVTLELSNTTPNPIEVYPGEGVAQFLFLRSDGHREALAEMVIDHEMFTQDTTHDPTVRRMLAAAAHKLGCRDSYADKKGRYQDQGGLTLPFVKGV